MNYKISTFTNPEKIILLLVVRLISSTPPQKKKTQEIDIPNPSREIIWQIITGTDFEIQLSDYDGFCTIKVDELGIYTF